MGDCNVCNGEKVLFYHGEVCICADCSDGMKLSNYIVSIRSMNKQLEQRLKEAEEIIKFYADTINWSYQQIIDDVSEVKGSLEAGKHARVYMEKYKGDNND